MLFQGMKEENAVINAIRQSLMQCEKVSKSPVSSSPGPPVYPVQSPVSYCHNTLYEMVTKFMFPKGIGFIVNNKTMAVANYII